MIEIYKIDKNRAKVESIKLSDAAKELKSFSSFLWVDVKEPPGEWPENEVALFLKDVLNIHFLILEDCVARKHFPKTEQLQELNFFIISKIFEREDKEIDTSKVSFVIGKNFILTYRHIDLKELSFVKKQLMTSTGSISAPVDIFYNVSDKIVDEYLAFVDKFTEEIDKTEDLLFDKPDSADVLKNINFLRKNMIIIKRNAILQKDIFYKLFLDEIKIDSSKKNIYFRDIYDHLDRVIGKIENQKDYLTGLLNIQIGLSGQKLNSIVKFLTVISATLLPATLISGVFGMNFKHMPIVEWQFGFYIVLITMSVFALFTVVFFFIKKWM